MLSLAKMDYYKSIEKRIKIKRQPDHWLSFTIRRNINYENFS